MNETGRWDGGERLRGAIEAWHGGPGGIDRFVEELQRSHPGVPGTNRAMVQRYLGGRAAPSVAFLAAAADVLDHRFEYLALERGGRNDAEELARRALKESRQPEEPDQAQVRETLANLVRSRHGFEPDPYTTLAFYQVVLETFLAEVREGEHRGILESREQARELFDTRTGEIASELAELILAPFAAWDATISERRGNEHLAAMCLALRLVVPERGFFRPREEPDA
jgi:transcriptional regulator with XRE-family HTH domain